MNIRETYKYIRKNDLHKYNQKCQISFDIIKFRFCKIVYGYYNEGEIIELKKKKWLVYTSERNSIYDQQEFTSESEACVEYLRRLRYFGYIK